MILPKIRDPRFITIRRGGILTDENHRLLALWAADCAGHVLSYFEKVSPYDTRPHRAIEAALSWADGNIKMMQAKTAAGAAQDAAREIKAVSEPARLAALSAGQAAAVASEVLLRKTGAENDVEARRFLTAPPLFARFFHVAAHELGAAAYAIRAVMKSVPKTERETARQIECEWQRSRIPAPVRELVLDDQRLRNDICWFAFNIRRTL